MRPWELWIAEARVLGGISWLAPAWLGIGILALMLGLEGAPGTQQMRVFLAWLGVQGLLPLLAGMFAASSVAWKQVCELHGTLPLSYQRTVFTRLLLVAGWHAGIGASLYAWAQLLGLWPQTVPVTATPLHIVAEVIACLAPPGWCTAIGASTALLLQSPTAGRVLLALAWFGMMAAFAGMLPPERWWLFQAGMVLSGGGGLGIVGQTLRARAAGWPAQEEEA